MKCVACEVDEVIEGRLVCSDECSATLDGIGAHGLVIASMMGEGW